MNKIIHNKKNKKIIAIFLLAVIILPMFSITSYATGTDEEVKSASEKVFSFLRSTGSWFGELGGNVLGHTLAKVFHGFGRTLEGLFIGENSSIGSIVYNQNNNRTTLQGGRGGDISNFLYEFYNYFNYMAVIFFVPIGMWFAVTLSRAGENAQRKAELKEKGFRLLVTFFWLTAMPQLLDWIFMLNNAFVQSFYSIITSVTGTGVASKGVMLEYMRELSWEADSLAFTFAYIATVFINVYLVIFYFIRDLTISMLFIIFPIVAIFYPLKKEATMTWWKEMFGNIITQSIHAMIMSVVMGMSYFLNPVTATSGDIGFSNAMFVVIGFYMIIPFTRIIKSMLGFEGTLGGAKSMAGLGAMYGAIRLGSMGVQGLKAGTSMMSSSLKERKSAKMDQEILETKGEKDALTGELKAVNKDGETITQKSVNQRLRESNKRIARSGASVATGLTTGIGTAAGTMAFGSATTALMAGAGATYVGAKVGDKIGKGGSNAVAGGITSYSDFKKYRNAHASELDKEEGLTSPVLQGTEYKERERKALRKAKYLQNFGFNEKAKQHYAVNSPKEISNEELQRTKGVEMYQDRNQTVFYGKDKNGNKKILKTGLGNPNIKKPITRKVDFTDGELSLPKSREDELLRQAEREISQGPLGDKIRDRAIQHVESSGESLDTEVGGAMFAKFYQGDSLDQSELFNSENSQYYDKDLHNEYKRAKASTFSSLKKNELNEVKTMRDTLGVAGLTYASKAETFEGTPKMFDRKEEIKAVESKPLSSLQKETATYHGIEGSKISDTKTGYALSSNEGTTYYSMDVDSNDIKAIGYSTETNHNIPTNQMEMTPIKVDNGEVYKDNVKYMLEGSQFYDESPMNLQTFDNAEERLGQEVMGNIQNDSQVIVRVNVNKQNNTGTYGVYDVSSGKHIGSSPIPKDYIDEGKEMNGKVYHMQVDSLGNIMKNKMDYANDKNFHQMYSAQGKLEQEANRIQETRLREEKLKSITEEKRAIEEMIRNSGLNNDVSTSYLTGIQ